MSHFQVRKDERKDEMETFFIIYQDLRISSSIKKNKDK